MGISDRYQIYAEQDAKAVNEAYKAFAKANAKLNGTDESCLKMAEEIEAKLNEYRESVENLKKTEETKMEKKEEKKQITSKQAIKAIGRNFGRWIKDHKWQIAGCAVGTAIIGSIWHKSAAIADQEHEQISLYNDNWDGNEHCFDADGYFNWKKDPDDKWSLTFILEPTDTVTPEEFNDILELLRKDYQDDYEVMGLCDALAENINSKN